MAETIETIPETKETIPATNESTPEQKESIPETPVQPEPKKRGRPKGAPDKAPRKKKIVIVEEAPKPEVPEPPAEPAPTRAAKASSSTEPPPSPGMHLHEPEPPSPRTTLREASRHILQLQTLRDVARKSHLSSLYTKGLHSLI